MRNCNLQYNPSNSTRQPKKSSFFVKTVLIWNLANGRYISRQCWGWDWSSVTMERIAILYYLYSSGLQDITRPPSHCRPYLSQPPLVRISWEKIIWKKGKSNKTIDTNIKIKHFSQWICSASHRRRRTCSPQSKLSLLYLESLLPSVERRRSLCGQLLCCIFPCLFFWKSMTVSFLFFSTEIGSSQSSVNGSLWLSWVLLKNHVFWHNVVFLLI